MNVVFLVFSACLVMTVFGRLGNNGSTRGLFRRLSVLSERAEIRDNSRGGWLFPDTLAYSFKIDGLGVRQIRANRLKLRSLRTKVMKMGPESQLQEKYRLSPEMGFYTNSDGSFACVPTFLDGQTKCDMFGIVHGDSESCFFHGERAFCRKTVDKTGQVFDYINNTREEHRAVRDTENNRWKLNIPTPLSSARVVQLAIFLDESMMDDFYAFSPSNDDEAELMAEMYAKMTANEITYRYQQVKKQNIPYRDGILDLAVNPASVIYPEKGNDFVFVQKIGNQMLSSVLNNFGRYVEANPPEPFQHAMLFTRLDMYFGNTGILGQTQLSTVCSENPSKADERISINEDLDYNVAGTATHELGHALGAVHDAGRFLSACASGRYIMSSTAVIPSVSTQDSVFRFSICSSLNFRSHLLRQPDCLSRASDEDFLENFCAGSRGTVENSLDQQCKTYYENGPDAKACGGITAVSAEGCWRPNSLSCDPGTGSCRSILYVTEGTPCQGADPGKTYYCYLGDCIEETELCPLEPTCFCDNFTSAVARNICCVFASCC